MSPGALSPAVQAATRTFATLLEARTGQILSENRMWRIETALKPVLRVNKIGSLEELASRVSPGGPPDLVNSVINALLNNESSFFRDLPTFTMLARDLLPHLAAAHPDKKALRIWCAGCSTGQEAYSLAMQIRKDEAQWQGWRISILATDISTAAVAQAQSGVYSQIDVQRGLAVADLLRWFDPVGDDWKVSDELRRMIDFRVDNLLDPRAPSGYYDLILCRNVLLYFPPDKRRLVFDRLAARSRPGGYLLLGAGETVMGQTDDFVASRDFRGSYERYKAPARAVAGRRG